MKNINPKNMGLKSYKTEVSQNDNKILIRYQGNLIATYEDNLLIIDNCGWKSQTTKQRLNVILDYYMVDFGIVQRDGKWYLINDKSQIAIPFLGTARFLAGTLLSQW